PGYDILEELGRGGMGVVYKAWQPGPNRLVALKMIRAGDYASPQELARFRTEAEAVGRLQHPHIVQISEGGEHDGLPYLALEYVAGGSLAQYLNGTPLPARDAAQLVEVLARAVQHAHQRGIVHRDLTPGNVLLASGGHQPPESCRSPDAGGSRPPLARWRPQLTAFGPAKAVIGGGAPPTPAGGSAGAPTALGPDHAGGRR